MLTRPRALLLDFGGVIADGPDQPGWQAAIAEQVRRVLTGAGVEPVPPEAVAGGLAAERWPVETLIQPDHATLWRDVIGAGWPPAARAAVVLPAAELSRQYMQLRHAGGWRLREGMAGLLADAAGHGLPMAVVSNTLCGAPHREFLVRAGVAGRFTAQFYSDEQGIRKPNPELARRAAAALAVDPAGCWFVGDTRSRDVLVARRAGLGAAILMRSPRTEPDGTRPDGTEPDGTEPDGTEPDVEVADPRELHRLLAAHW